MLLKSLFYNHSIWFPSFKKMKIYKPYEKYNYRKLEGINKAFY